MYSARQGCKDKLDEYNANQNGARLVENAFAFQRPERVIRFVRAAHLDPISGPNEKDLIALTSLGRKNLAQAAERQ